MKVDGIVDWHKIGFRIDIFVVIYSLTINYFLCCNYGHSYWNVFGDVSLACLWFGIFPARLFFLIWCVTNKDIRDIKNSEKHMVIVTSHVLLLSTVGMFIYLAIHL